MSVSHVHPSAEVNFNRGAADAAADIANNRPNRALHIYANTVVNGVYIYPLPECNPCYCQGYTSAWQQHHIEEIRYKS